MLGKTSNKYRGMETYLSSIAKGNEIKAISKKEK
jgi:hypothetical protein